MTVTWFGEISPLWQQKLSVRQFLVGLFSYEQNFETALANVFAIRLLVIVLNSQILKNILGIWSH